MSFFNYAIELLMLGVNCVGGDVRNVPATQRARSWKPRAFQMNMYPCVYTYSNISYERGVLVEQIVSTAPLVEAVRRGNRIYYLSGNFPPNT